MPVEPRCPACAGLLGEEDCPGGQCPPCAWKAVGHALELEHPAILVARWGSLVAVLTQGGFLLRGLVKWGPGWEVWEVLLDAVLAGLVALFIPLAAAAFLLMLGALRLHWSVPPVVRLREPALVAVGCVAAAGLALVAAVLVGVITRWGEADLAPTILAGTSLLLWVLAH